MEKTRYVQIKEIQKKGVEAKKLYYEIPYWKCNRKKDTVEEVILNHLDMLDLYWKCLCNAPVKPSSDFYVAYLGLDELDGILNCYLKSPKSVVQKLKESLPEHPLFLALEEVELKEIRELKEKIIAITHSDSIDFSTECHPCSLLKIE